jgi:hypothetical protein
VSKLQARQVVVKLPSICSPLKHMQIHRTFKATRSIHRDLGPKFPRQGSYRQIWRHAAHNCWRAQPAETYPVDQRSNKWQSHVRWKPP